MSHVSDQLYNLTDDARCARHKQVVSRLRRLSTELSKALCAGDVEGGRVRAEHELTVLLASSEGDQALLWQSALEAVRTCREIAPGNLPFELQPTAAEHQVSEDGIPDKWGRVVNSEAGAKWAKEYGYDTERDCWSSCGHHVPIDVLRAGFSTDELIRIWHAQAVASQLSKWIEHDHPWLFKLHQTLSRFAFPDNSYDLLVRLLQQLKTLTWPGMSLKLTWVSDCRADGWSEHLPSLWVDNDFGLLVCQGGKHVLTVGFGLGLDGVYVSQIQLRQKKGNRWLYHVDGHYADVALDVMARAFGDVWLVEGESAVAAVIRAYRKHRHTVDAAAHARIVSLYDRAPARLMRTGESAARDGRLYMQLVPRPVVKDSQQNSIETAAKAA